MVIPVFTLVYIRAKIFPPSPIGQVNKRERWAYISGEALKKKRSEFHAWVWTEGFTCMSFLGVSRKFSIFALVYVKSFQHPDQNKMHSVENPIGSWHVWKVMNTSMFNCDEWCTVCVFPSSKQRGFHLTYKCICTLINLKNRATLPIVYTLIDRKSCAEGLLRVEIHFPDIFLTRKG